MVRPAGARASPHWTPHAQANAKSNPAQSSRLRAAHIAAFKEWEPAAHPGPLEYVCAVPHSPSPPGFGRSGSRQRPEPRVRAHPTGRTIGPGTYDRTGFGTFSRYEAQRQELWRTDRPSARKVSHSHPQGRPTSTRTRDDPGDPPHLASPGPGQYDLERYSQFVVNNSYNQYGRSVRRATSSFGTGSRSDITMTHGDTRCMIQCPIVQTPSTNRYAAVPRLDRITLSSPRSPAGHIEPLARGKSPFLHSAQSLRLTLSDIAAHSPRRSPRPDLTARLSPHRPATAV